jgi:hypothetical protein
MSSDDTEQYQPARDEGHQDSHKAGHPRYSKSGSESSAHSSRSSSFNASAAEIILGRFQEDSMDPGFHTQDDPIVQEALMLQLARDPNSWVSKLLARPDLWTDDGIEASVYSSTSSAGS